MMLEVTRSNRAFPHTFLDWRAKVPKWRHLSLGQPMSMTISEYRVTSTRRTPGYSVFESGDPSCLRLKIHLRTSVSGFAWRGSEGQRRRKHGGMPRTWTVQRPALRWSFSHDPECARALLSCVYHPGYNATTVAELSSSVYAERNPADRKVKRAYAHERFMTARIDDIPR